MIKKEGLTESMKSLMIAANAVAKCGDVNEFYENAKSKNSTKYQSLVEVDGQMQLLTLMRDEKKNPENFSGFLLDTEAREVSAYMFSTAVKTEDSDSRREMYYFNSKHECVKEDLNPNFLKALTGKLCGVVDEKDAKGMDVLMTLVERECDNTVDAVMGE